MGGNNTVRHVTGFHKHTHIRCTYRHTHTYIHMCTHACICVYLYHCHTGVSQWGAPGICWVDAHPQGRGSAPQGPGRPTAGTSPRRQTHPSYLSTMCLYLSWLSICYYLPIILYRSFSMHLSVTIYQPIIYIYIINI